MSNSNGLTTFKVKQLLGGHGEERCQYTIPMYQRNYAWGEGEIQQLIQDVLDMLEKHQNQETKKTYYIGTLVVYERSKNHFEVIDGQQRFTTLTLLTLCLQRAKEKHFAKDIGISSWFSQPNLAFESRELSSTTLAGLQQGEPLDELRNEACNPDLLHGYELMEKHLLALGDQLKAFCEYLFNHVVIVRVSVPQDTDLNHYFEAMNIRGEQLEKHEVLKARMMAALHAGNDADKAISLKVLTQVWDATANMERYIQYGFSTEQRKELFGSSWDQFLPKNFQDLCERLSVNEEGTELIENASDQSLKSFRDILDQPAPALPDKKKEALASERFSSVVNFPNFLLQVLRVWSGKNIALDDKQLIDQFEEHVLRSDNPAENVKEFVFALLKIKFLFDHYIIKREFISGDDSWSLKRLDNTGKSAAFNNSFGKEEDEEASAKDINKTIVMLQSAFHVSTPTQSYKHWLNGALYGLYQMKGISAHEYLDHLEQLASQFVYGRYLNPEGEQDYYTMIYNPEMLGSLPNFSAQNPEVTSLLKYAVVRSNMVFNYLDYLIWKEAIPKGETNKVITQFEFTSRSSVEHFAPQHPFNGEAPLPDELLHSFGNLCLISSSKNSKVSNIQPQGKKDHFQASISRNRIDTLKLYKMIKLMERDNAWGEEQIRKHEQDMLRLLSDANREEK